MKALSILNYSKKNKSKVVSSIISVLIAVSFLYCINTFTKSINESLYKLTVSSYKNHATITAYDNEDIIEKVKNNENIERILPFMCYELEYSIPGSLNFADVIALKAEYINYFLEKEYIKVMVGRLPKEGTKEIAVDYLVAKNRKITIDDTVGNSIDSFDEINGEYRVVGILRGENMLSIVAFNSEILKDYENREKSLQRGILLVPKKNKSDEVNKFVESLPKGEAVYSTLNILKEKFYKDLGCVQFLDVTSILAIFLMVITVGSSKYVEFFNRKEEIGIINAIGYSKSKILKNAMLEVLIINIIAYTLGLILGISLSYLVGKNIFESIGAVGVVFDKKAFIVSLYIPLFTVLFTLIPINGMVNSLNPIDMIENN